MTISQFENLLKKPESSNLDFKRNQYEIINDSGDIKTAEFIKDIISFSNTIRSETAYIIIGIGIKENGDKEMIGLNKHIDDSIFQDKVKNKVFPIPQFLYYTIQYDNKTYGIIEIPIKKYSEPISATIKMKGLEIGKIYFRRGSTNSEATGREVIMINKWLESLPEEVLDKALSDEISQIILNITSRKHYLSECIVQIMQVANKYNLSELKEFCNNELTGWWNKVSDEDVPNVLSYRMNKVVFSPYEVEFNPYHRLNSTQLIDELKNTEGFYEQLLLFAQPVTEIEKILSRINEKPNNSLVTLTSTAERMFPDKNLGDIPIKVYACRDNFENIYNGIRQKLIDMLVEIS